VLGDVKTYPILKADGSLHAFEIRTPLLLIGIVKLLRSIKGVEGVSTKTNVTEDRVYFTFEGHLQL
jgi:hypothetical protein